MEERFWFLGLRGRKRLPVLTATIPANMVLCVADLPVSGPHGCLAVLPVCLRNPRQRNAVEF